ncbi:MAG: ribbon-helix-helix domain-containing protein [Actinomycetota bacterium]|nr:ribbon-helix-helix domain-containing protein [Actinomycetota bacterium]MDQ3680116.1 ribbon-helix-helix domain-containing protein [Actinomycetota bacterium]
MARVQTIVQLNRDLLALLDREATRRGVSRSALVRTALEEFLHADRERMISERIVDGYTRIPPGAADDWGDLEAMTERATTDLSRRLDAEERGHGHEPW